jgi:flagellar protein FlaF
MSSSPPPRPPSDRRAAGKVSGSYGALAKRHAGKREVEAQALLKAARMMQELQNDWDKQTPEKIESALKFNRNIWVIFYDNATNDSAPDAPSPPFRKNVVNLANFVFKRSVDILAAPEKTKLSVLININREVAAGLMTPPQEKSSTSSG